MKNKKVLQTVLSLTAVVFLFTGCQKTPEEGVVREKDQDKMLGMAVNGGENSVLLPALDVPERFTGEWTGADGYVAVHADAAVWLPQVPAVPTAAVEKRSFTQADIDRVLSVFIGDNVLYEEKGFTRQDAQKELEKWQAVARGEIAMKDVIDPEKGMSQDQMEEYVKNQIKSLAEMVNTLPDENERFAAELEDRGEFGKHLAGTAEVGGKTVHVEIEADTDWSDSILYYADGYLDLASQGAPGVPISELGISSVEGITEAEALEEAAEFAEKIGLSAMACGESREVAYVKDGYRYVTQTGGEKVLLGTGYEVELIRTVQGVPVNYTGNIGFSGGEGESVDAPWEYETVTVGVTKDGVVYFKWNSPVTEPVTEIENAKLLDFEEIAKIFQKMIFVENSDVITMKTNNGFEIHRSFEVDRVSLGLGRIRSKGNIRKGLLVPVWDFWGTFSQTTDGHGEIEEYKILFTINAIDGTVIDRTVGY